MRHGRDIHAGAAGPQPGAARFAYGAKRLVALVAAAALLLASQPAFSARPNPRAEVPLDFAQAVKGKTVAWVPVTMSTSIDQMWTGAMRQDFDKFGVKLVVRDPNFDSNAQLQAVTSLIDEKPDVLVVQNINVSALARELKRAMDNGIFVIQVNIRAVQRCEIASILSRSLMPARPAR